MAVVWQKTQDRLGDVASRISEMSKRQDSLQHESDELTKMGILTTISQHERRISNMESAVSDLSGMRTDISWIKRNMSGRGGMDQS